MSLSELPAKCSTVQEQASWLEGFTRGIHYGIEVERGAIDFDVVMEYITLRKNVLQRELAELKERLHAESAART